MKTLRQFCTASVLTLALMLPALAGDIHTTVAPPPPPNTQGEITTGVTEGEIDTPAMAIMLNLLQTAMSLF